jgi:hypothetical protein
MMRISTARQEELLALAEQLAATLKRVRVPRLEDRSEETVGVPASVVEHAASYLARVRDLARFRELLAQFDRLDRMTAQNPDNPKADHRVTRQELERFLGEEKGLSADELLFVLSWVRRLLPKSVEASGPERGRKGPRGPRPEDPTAADEPPGELKGGQMAAAFQRALKPAPAPRKQG